MYREHLRNSNTAAIYDDIYENIGGYKLLCSPRSTFEGDGPLLPPSVSAPGPSVSLNFGVLFYDEMFKVQPTSGGAYCGGCPRTALSRSYLLFAAAVRFLCRSMRAIWWWPIDYSLLCRRPLGALSDDAVCVSVCLSVVYIGPKSRT